LLVDVIVKLVLLVIALTNSLPTVPPGDWIVRKILELELLAFVVETVTVPFTSVAVPIVALDPVVILRPLPPEINTLPVTSKFSVGVDVPIPHNVPDVPVNNIP
jgi:hypothetical protein